MKSRKIKFDHYILLDPLYYIQLNDVITVFELAGRTPDIVVEKFARK